MLFLALAAAAAVPQPAPQPGPLKTYGDWTVGCDNGRACQAVALVPGASDRAAYLLLVIERDGAPAAAPSLRVPLDAVPRGATVTLRIDGAAVAQLVSPGGDGGLVLPFDRKLYAALGQGKRVTLDNAAGKTLRSASLTGAAAALLYIDDQQHRLGTRDALIRTGPGPSNSTAGPPPLPVIVQPPAGTKAPRTLSVKDATRLIGPDNARCDNASGPVQPEAVRLDAVHSLVLVSHPCGNGAYNAFTSAFVLGEKSSPTPAQFDAPIGMAQGLGNILTNARWDPSTRRLTERVKGRGLGDCGSASDFAWDGTRFRLARQTAMGECRGSIDYITTWRARMAGS